MDVSLDPLTMWNEYDSRKYLPKEIFVTDFEGVYV